VGNKKPLSSNQQRIEGMYQRAMNFRDSSPGWLPDRLENSYDKAYRACFRAATSTAVNHFRQLTRGYRRVLRQVAAEERTKVGPESVESAGKELVKP
jgi:hypothetical protein